MFGDRDSGRYLVKFSWTPIVRHILVKGRASPYDPALAGYWATRRRRAPPPLGPLLLRLMRAQDGRCPVCELCRCTPISSRRAPPSGNSGSPRCARRSATRRSLHRMTRRTRTHAA